MRVLLDTHAFLWWVTDDDRLSSRARRTISDGRNEVLVSAVSGWEIAVKVDLGRLTIPDPPDRFIPPLLRDNAFGTMPVTMSHTLAVSRLEPIHRDPFDRLLVAQATIERLTIVTADPDVARYPIRTVW